MGMRRPTPNALLVTLSPGAAWRRWIRPGVQLGFGLTAAVWIQGALAPLLLQLLTFKNILEAGVGTEEAEVGHLAGGDDRQHDIRPPGEQAEGDTRT